MPAAAMPLSAAAAEVEPLRQALLAIVSHELRSPLSGIQSWTHVLAQSLQRAMASPTAAPELPKAERALAGIVAGVRRQVEMVDSLIAAARVLSGEISLRCTPFDMRDAVNAALQPFQGAVAQRGLHVEQLTRPPIPCHPAAQGDVSEAAPSAPSESDAGPATLASSVPSSAPAAALAPLPETSIGSDTMQAGGDWQTIVADFDRTVGILRHLVSNAIKFNERGGTIRLTVGTDCPATGMPAASPNASNALNVSNASNATDTSAALSDKLVVSIENTGVGITPDAMSIIFDSFTQVNQSYSRHREGLGLGLAVANRLAHVQGGHIHAQSEGDKHGATFTLTLPREVCQAAPVPPPTRRAALAFPSLAGLSIMVVDDQLEARESLAAVLEQSGAEVLPAESGQDAIAQLEARGATREPDVLICDIAMPGEDGYTTLSRIRAWEKDRGVVPGRRLAAIAVTAFAQREDRDRALSRGYALHFAKPVDPNRLLGAVAELVAK